MHGHSAETFYGFCQTRPFFILQAPSTQTALVVGRVFRGANYLYRLQLADGQTVLSLVASHHNHEIGSQIGILPILEHVVVFDEKDINATTWSEYDRSERVEDVR